MIAIPIPVDGHIVDEATAASDLPPTSNESSAQYFGYVWQITIHSATSHLLEVYPVRSFTIGPHDQMDDETKATPLPPLVLCRLKPEAFRAPLAVVGNWSSSRNSWLYIVPRGSLCLCRDR